jgi:hypothetical protein
MLYLYAWMHAQLYTLGRRIEERIEDEGGLETVEVIALIGVMVALLVAVMRIFQKDHSVGEAALAKLVQWINSLGTSA